MIIIGLSFAPIVHGIVGIDKFYHVVAFFCLVFPITLIKPRFIVLVFFGVMIFGGLIELGQNSFGRQASWADFLANGIGAIFGVMIARFLGLRLFGSSKVSIKRTKS